MVYRFSPEKPGYRKRSIDFFATLQLCDHYHCRRFSNRSTQRSGDARTQRRKRLNPGDPGKRLGSKKPPRNAGCFHFQGQMTKVISLAGLGITGEVGKRGMNSTQVPSDEKLPPVVILKEAKPTEESAPYQPYSPQTSKVKNGTCASFGSAEIPRQLRRGFKEPQRSR